MTGRLYDGNDPAAIQAYASRLEGRTLRELGVSGAALRKGKGGFGHLVESGYFGIDPGNSPLPDFATAGVELKTCPFIRKNHRPVPKERLVLGMIDYFSVALEEWAGSSVRKKMAKMLVVFYEHLDGVELIDRPILFARLWKFSDQDLRVIRDDWEFIAARIREGRGHELSEGDTNYLGASTKSSKGSVRRKQPYSDEPVKPRAFSFRPSYVKAMLDEFGAQLPELMQVLPSGAQVSGASTGFEQTVIDRIERYRGQSLSDIGAAVGVESDAKSRFAMVVARLVTGHAEAAGTHQVEEFVKSGITVKTVRIGSNDVPYEHMSFPPFKASDIAGQRWEESDLRAQLDGRFLLVVAREEPRHAQPVLLGAFFWAMPEVDKESARKDWEATRKLITEGRVHRLPRSSESHIAHVRPHGKKTDVDHAPSGESFTRSSFWLNRRYVAKQIPHELRARKGQGALF